MGKHNLDALAGSACWEETVYPSVSAVAKIALAKYSSVCPLKVKVVLTWSSLCGNNGAITPHPEKTNKLRQ